MVPLVGCVLSIGGALNGSFGRLCAVCRLSVEWCLRSAVCCLSVEC